MILKIFKYIIIAFAIQPNSTVTGPVNTVYFDFEVIKLSNNDLEIIQGRLFKKMNNELVLFIERPIKQYIYIKSKSMFLYYPRDLKAFSLKSAVDFNMSYYNTFINYHKEDLGLTEINYTLSEVNTYTDSLYFIWSPPEKLSKQIGKCVLKYNRKYLFEADYYNKQGQLKTKILFSDIIIYNGINFPRQIVTEDLIDPCGLIEFVNIDNIEFNKTLPDSIINFKIPDNVIIKKIRL